MAKILITGGAGFIGSHLAERLLAEDREVVVLDDFSDAYDPRLKRANVARLEGRPGFRLVEGDIRDRGLVEHLYRREGIASTVHLAARTGARQSIRESHLSVDVNQLGTVTLLDAARKWGAYTFLFGSSSSVYGASPRVPFAEDDPVARPLSPYAATKRAGELLGHTYHHLYGMKVTCLRLFTVYGPRQGPEMAIARFTDGSLRGEPLPFYGDGGSARDYTFVDDVVEGVVRALDRAAGFEVLNLGGGRPTTLARLVELIAGATGTRPRLERLPDQPGDVPVTHADISRAREVLGWSPTVPIEEGIRRFVEWYRGEGRGA